MLLSLAFLYMAFGAGPRLDLLKKELDADCTVFHGQMGYSVLDVASGRRISFRGDDLFPTASTIKTAVALEAVREVDAGTLKWTDVREVPPEDGREASMWSYFFKDGTKVDVDGYVNLMLTVSDNTATIVLRKWLTPEAVNKTTASLGLSHTKVLWDHFPDSDPEDRGLREKYGLGVTTPNEMNLLFEKLYRRQAASPAACEKILRILGHQYWDGEAGVSVPVGIATAIKTGAVDESRSECAIVWTKRPYILTIYTSGQKDQQWSEANEGLVSIRKMCASIYKTFAPDKPYQVPTGYDRFGDTGGTGE
jgi:beta-lactamase class A